MQVVQYGGFDNPTVEAAVYTGDTLHSIHARTPENYAVEALEHAFRIGNLNYKIYYDLPIQQVPERNSVCKEPFDTWNERVKALNVPRVADDTNVLLHDGRGGGCSNNPDKDPGRCVVGATPMANLGSWNLSGTNLSKMSIHHMLHEVGHNLGFSHDPHGGYAFDEDGYWYRTPTTAANDVNNLCGEYIEKRDNSRPHRYLFWHWCMIDKARLTEGDADPPPRSEYPPEGYEGMTAPRLARLPQPPAQNDGGSDCTYNGHPRADYTYTGNNDSAFTAWQNCEITTSMFQSATDPGHGTGALLAPGDNGSNGNGDTGGNGDGDAGGGPASNLGLLGAAALVAVALRDDD